MKRILSALAVLGLLLAHVACTPDDKNNGEGGGNQDELTVTGAALDVTDRSATLTGYANLPFELGDAEVGIMYDTKQSFEDGQKVAATVLDGNNMFTITVTGLAPSTTYYYKSYVQNGLAVKYGAVLSFTTKELVVLVESISMEKTYLPLLEGGSESLSVTVTPDEAKDQTLTWSSSNEAVASVDKNGRVTGKKRGVATITATANDGSGKTASCDVSVYRIDIPDAVDLGIVVDGKTIKWASFNLGASSPEEYGMYYAWGETEPKSVYSWSTYKWCNGGYNKLTRYCPENMTQYWDGSGTPDNKTEFADYNYADDAARAKLGGKWRMPTDAEWTALRDNCTWTWTTQNGVNGRLVTSKTNSNSIFLPAAGNRLNTDLLDAGSYGLYWSSSLRTNHPSNAWGVSFYSSYVFRFSYDRGNGRSVRPVSE